jgi:O-antigen ligase
VEEQKYSRGVQAFTVFVHGAVRFLWVPLVAILAIALLLDWAPWRKILAYGIAAALAIVVLPAILGVVLAIDSRRMKLKSQRDSSKGGPHE